MFLVLSLVQLFSNACNVESSDEIGRQKAAGQIRKGFYNVEFDIRKEHRDCILAQPTHISRGAGSRDWAHCDPRETPSSRGRQPEDEVDPSSTEVCDGIC